VIFHEALNSAKMAMTSIADLPNATKRIHHLSIDCISPDEASFEFMSMLLHLVRA
jgi:hypothetical protein